MSRRKSTSAVVIGALAVVIGLGLGNAWAQPQSARPAAGAGLTNDDVLRLVGAGLGDDTVVAKIRDSATSFDTSADALIQLKRAGVSDVVIRAMIDPRASAAPSEAAGPELEPGVYLERDGALVPIEPAIVTKTKTANRWGAAFSYGISKMKLKAVVPGATARNQVLQAKPVFHFRFGVSSAGLVFPVPSATSPKEFLLLRMEPKGDRREFQVGKLGIASAEEGANTDDKSSIAFQSERVGPGHYKVTVATPLASGEYCFFHPAGAAGPTAGAGGKLFDFGVRLEATAGSEDKQQAPSR